MAISLEELALGALEGGAGPWTLAVGAGALAVALAAGSSRPLRRMAASGAVTSVVTGAATARRASQRLPMSGIRSGIGSGVRTGIRSGVSGWIGGVRQGWRDLVAEARAEYEAGRSPSTLALAEPPIVLKPEDRAEPTPAAESEARVFRVEPPVAGERELPTLPEIAALEAASQDVKTPRLDAEAASQAEPPRARATRDRRGRFVRRQPPAHPPLSDTNGVRAE